MPWNATVIETSENNYNFSIHSYLTPMSNYIIKPGNCFILESFSFYSFKLFYVMPAYTGLTMGGKYGKAEI